MNKIILGLSLLLISASTLSGNDVWQTLFKQKLLEATQGSSDAQFDVGSMYQKGRGVKSDRALAIEWYEKASAQNNQKAAAKLNLMKANQARFNKELASAEKGGKKSQYNVGNMYKKGIGVNIDTTEAIKWYENSANQGHIKAGFKLGQIFYEGTGVKKNRDTAFKWFKVSAEGNYPPAQYYLGKMYTSGHGVKQSYSTALQWYSKAVDGGFNQARGEMIDVSER
ncbi:MAG: sel1 repeat family protein, partial [Gammaproteobacteria bacterium]|nr:sel1 repeat family protein [Gammaproteobacteria bacterium]